MKIIGKVKQKKGDRFMVIKIGNRYHARAKGKRWHKIGDAHNSISAARKEMNQWIKYHKK